MRITPTETSSNSVGYIFQPGQIVSTPNALAVMTVAGYRPSDLLARHLSGDWGDIEDEDIAVNALALDQGGQLFSAYQIEAETTIWIITEADRSVTTFLLPEEY